MQSKPVKKADDCEYICNNVVNCKKGSKRENDIQLIVNKSFSRTNFAKAKFNDYYLCRYGGRMEIKMKFKKLTVLLLVLVLALNICGCNKTSVDNSEVSSTTSDQTKGKDYITLLYSAADTFNPYTAKTDINRQLCQLLYEPLLTLDNELNTVYKIAKSVKVSGKSCTVTLNNIRFSDGSMLTAQDVVYSCNLAKTRLTNWLLCTKMKKKEVVLYGI